MQLSGEAAAKTVQVFPVSSVPASLYAWTVKESTAPAEPEMPAPATVTMTEVLPAETDVIVGVPGVRTFHCA